MLKIKIAKNLLLGYKDFLSYSCLASNKEGKNQKIKVAFSYPELLSKENIFNIFSSLIGISEGEINGMCSVGNIGTYGKKERDYLYLVTLMINNENLIKIQKHVKRYDFKTGDGYWQDEISTTEDDVSIFWFWGKVNGEAEEKIRIVKIIKEVTEYEIKHKYYLSDVEIEKNKFNGKWGKLFIPKISDEDLIKLI